MTSRTSWTGFVLILMLLLGGCTAISGNLDHWPALAAATAIMAAGKVANDRFRVVSWPMEFLLLSAVVMIVSTLVYLYFAELV
ncbi:hypothetical protein [Chelativorans sp.]|uniref:hypothetical protein n=1 Tax=Chelativorans sp. TaxID=2203393 RepID=UPI0028114C17|nr:hypothetical protein [Chelativorans sp.]